MPISLVFGLGRARVSRGQDFVKGRARIIFRLTTPTNNYS